MADGLIDRVVNNQAVVFPSEAERMAVALRALPLLLDVVEAAAPFSVGGFMTGTAEDVKHLREALAALNGVASTGVRDDTESPMT